MLFQDNTPDMHRYLIARYETATFRIESLSGVMPVRWEYSLYCKYLRHLSKYSRGVNDTSFFCSGQ